MVREDRKKLFSDGPVQVDTLGGEVAKGRKDTKGKKGNKTK
jgi:hypothetical protein